MRLFILLLAAAVLVAAVTASPASRVSKSKKTKTTPPPKKDTKLDKVRKAEARLTKTYDSYNEFVATQRVQFNWEELLSPAPLSIGVIGDLMIVASNTLDFPLDKYTNGTKRKFDYINNPRSFRATLTQISNQAYNAFGKADENMGLIYGFTANAPAKMKEVAELLYTKEPALIGSYLPLKLEAIKKVADRCTELAQGVVDKFQFVLDLTSETEEAVVSTKGGAEQELNEIRNNRTILEIKKRETDKHLKLLDEQNKSLEKYVEDSFQGLKKAHDEMPSGMKIIGMNLLEDLSAVVMNVVNSITNPLEIVVRPFRSLKGEED